MGLLLVLFVGGLITAAALKWTAMLVMSLLFVAAPAFLPAEGKKAGGRR